MHARTHGIVGADRLVRGDNQVTCMRVHSVVGADRLKEEAINTTTCSTCSTTAAAAAAAATTCLVALHTTPTTATITARLVVSPDGLVVHVAVGLHRVRQVV